MLRRVFDSMNTDGSADGLNVQEVQAAFQQLSKGFTLEEAEALVGAMDADKSGKVSFEEFVSGCRKFGGVSV
eukprot:885144-Prorocentrum_minimum.AAC.3